MKRSRYFDKYKDLKLVYILGISTKIFPCPFSGEKYLLKKSSNDFEKFYSVTNLTENKY